MLSRGDRLVNRQVIFCGWFGKTPIPLPPKHSQKLPVTSGATPHSTIPSSHLVQVAKMCFTSSSLTRSEKNRCIMWFTPAEQHLKLDPAVVRSLNRWPSKTVLKHNTYAYHWLYAQMRETGHLSWRHFPGFFRGNRCHPPAAQLSELCSPY